MHDLAYIRGIWICVRSKDAQKQLARKSLSEERQSANTVAYRNRCNRAFTEGGFPNNFHLF